MSQKLSRTATISKQQRDASADSGLVEMAIASESPYERWFGIEILSMSPDAVDLTRLADNSHPLLLNHCTDDQIGVVMDPMIGADKMLRVNAKFSSAPDAQQILQDIKDGIRSLVSVGYFIDEIEEIEPPLDPADIGDMEKWNIIKSYTGAEFERVMSTQHGDSWMRNGPSAKRDAGDTPPTFLVTRWTPFEASIVPIPADVSVGIGRSAGVDDLSEPEPQQAAPAAKPSIILMEQKMSDPKSPAELEIERRDGIIALATQYAKYLGANDASEWARNGKSLEAFKDFIIQKIETKHSDVSGVAVGMTAKDIKRYSFGKALQASVTGDWRGAGLEREASEAVAKIIGRQAEGFYLPAEAFHRDFLVGTGSLAGNLVPTYLRDDMYVDALRNNMVMGQLGVRILGGLTGNIDMPRKATVSTIGTTSEAGSASQTDPTTAKVTLSPKRQTAYVVVSKQAIIQSAMSLEAMIRDDLVTGSAVSIENQSINGAGTANQMTGIRNTTGIGTTTAGANGAAVAWANVVALESACANANAEPDQLAGYLINTKQRGNLKTIQKGTNLPFIWDGGAQPLNGYRSAISNNVPSNLTKGTSTTICSAALFGSDWSMATIGLFGAPDITVDPYSLADKGEVKITLNQFADFGIRQPACFAKIEDLL